MKRKQYSVEQIVGALKPADLIAPHLRPGAAIHIEIFNQQLGTLLVHMAKCNYVCSESTWRPAPKKPRSDLASFSPRCKQSQSPSLTERPLPEIAHLSCNR